MLYVLLALCFDKAINQGLLLILLMLLLVLLQWLFLLFFYIFNT